MIQNVTDVLHTAERHFEILEVVIEKQPIGIVALSNETGHPRHNVRYSLSVLEDEGLIEPTYLGAVTTEKTAPFVELTPERFDRIIEKLEALGLETSTVTP